MFKAGNNALPSDSCLSAPWHTILHFVQELHNVPSVSHQRLENFTEKAKKKNEVFREPEGGGEMTAKYLSTWDTYTQIWKTSAYCMRQVASLNNVFLLNCSFQALPQKKSITNDTQPYFSSWTYNCFQF